MKTLFSTVMSIFIIFGSMLYITHEYNEHVRTTTIDPECAKLVTAHEVVDGIHRDLQQYCSIEQ
jgi:non-homologous end joining protein Ku